MKHDGKRHPYKTQQWTILLKKKNKKNWREMDCGGRKKYRSNHNQHPTDIRNSIVSVPDH